jgi:hypothetical protein
LTFLFFQDDKKRTMRRILCFTLALGCAVTGSAQVLRSKEGYPVLPAKGDWSIGFDATRLIKLATLDFVSQAHIITGKLMIDSATAYRAGVRIGINSWTTRNRAVNRGAAQSNTNSAHPAPLTMNDNMWQRNAFTSGVSFGIEKRRGGGRIQGIYGVEGGIFISNSTDKFSYASGLNASGSNPINVDSSDAMTSPILGSANNINTSPPIVGVNGWARVVERNNGFGVSVGARAFVGAEFFPLPKLSVGGEFGWGLSYTTTGRSTITYESIGVGSGGPGVRRTTLEGSSTNVFSFDTDSGAGFGGPSASLRVNIYF